MTWEILLSSATLWTVLIGAISNTSCALLGCYLVLRRQSLLGDAISHSILPGIVLAYLATGALGSLPIVIGAMTLGLLTTFLTETLRRYGHVPEDASMGVVFTSLFAVGVLIIALFARNAHIDDCVLYGLIELIPFDTVRFFGLEIPRATFTLGIALLAVVVYVLALWKELKLVSFDPQLASAMGINASLMHYSLMAMVALVSVTSFEAVGSILVIAMLIVPAATAQMLTDRLRWMLVCAVVAGWIAALLGTWGAIWLDTSVAGMMAVTVGVEFGLAVIFGPRHGILSTSWHSLKLTLRITAEDILATLYRSEEQQGPVPVPLTHAMQRAWRAPRGWIALGQMLILGDLRLRGGSRTELTSKGRIRAQSLVRAHRLWEAYLGQEFHLPLDHLHAPAERVEHFLGPSLQAQLARQLSEARRDPHGKEIPGGHDSQNSG